MKLSSDCSSALLADTPHSLGHLHRADTCAVSVWQSIEDALGRDRQRRLADLVDVVGGTRYGEPLQLLPEGCLAGRALLRGGECPALRGLGLHQRGAGRLPALLGSLQGALGIRQPLA